MSINKFFPPTEDSKDIIQLFPECLIFFIFISNVPFLFSQQEEKIHKNQFPSLKATTGRILKNEEQECLVPDLRALTFSIFRVL